ncbi:MAG TPA: FAD:protein FMN transferase [bacterium]|nr:FAD:protein FMN transferase [bacterium]
MRKILRAAPLLLPLIVSCAAEERDGFFAMDTVVELCAVGGESALDAARRAVEDVEGWADCYDPEAELYRLNLSAGGGPVRVSKGLAEVLEVSLRVAEKSGGAFDPTVLPLVEAYGFNGEKRRVPGDEEISRILPRVDYRRVGLAGDGVDIPEGVALDLGGVAKGYAADRALEAMKEAGAEAGLVNIGGDIAVFGERAGGGSWTIGVQHPRAPGELFAVLELQSGAVATSGDYERYFIEDGVRYHHILDPRTGRPARGLVSVTVTAPVCVLADAYATAVFVLGPEEGLRLLEADDDLEGLLIFAKTDGGLDFTVTDGLEGRLELLSGK